MLRDYKNHDLALVEDSLVENTHLSVQSSGMGVSKTAD